MSVFYEHTLERGTETPHPSVQVLTLEPDATFDAFRAVNLDFASRADDDDTVEYTEPRGLQEADGAASIGADIALGFRHFAENTRACFSAYFAHETSPIDPNLDKSEQEQIRSSREEHVLVEQAFVDSLRQWESNMLFEPAVTTDNPEANPGPVVVCTLGQAVLYMVEERPITDFIGRRYWGQLTE